MPVAEQFDKYGASQGFQQKGPNGNKYSQLDNPKRAQEIITEAKSRLAAGRGKASDLQAMIHKVTNERAVADSQNQSTNRGAQGYQQPNNMESYIDKVLGMSGMSDATGGTNAGQVPVPSDRPADGAETGGVTPDLPEGTTADTKSAGEGAEGESGGSSMGNFANLALGALGAVGAAKLGKYMYDKYSKGNVGEQIAGTIDEGRTVIGKQLNALEADQAMPTQKDDMASAPSSETKQLTGPDNPKQLTGPTEPKQLTYQPVPQGPKQLTAVDRSIESTMSPEDQAAQDYVERGTGGTKDGGRASSQPRYTNEDKAAQANVENNNGGRPSTQRRYNGADKAYQEEIVMNAQRIMQTDGPEAAMQYLDDNGVTMDTVKSLAKRVIGNTVRQAVK